MGAEDKPAAAAARQRQSARRPRVRRRDKGELDGRRRSQDQRGSRGADEKARGAKHGGNSLSRYSTALPPAPPKTVEPASRFQVALNLARAGAAASSPVPWSVTILRPIRPFIAAEVDSGPSIRQTMCRIRCRPQVQFRNRRLLRDDRRRRDHRESMT